MQQALQAQQDTIKRQKQMLDDQERHTQQQLRKKDQDIAELTASLNKLARTKTQELEHLPTLFKELQTSMTEQTSVFNGWVAYRKEHVTTQSTLISELLVLGNVQMQLVEQLKTYQSTITPFDYLESDTVKLEDGLSELVNAQNKIKQSQTKITDSQTEIQTELKELNRLLSKLES
ncbi:hypothetical protein I6E61_09885 [Psychrobacter sp. NZS113]|uniref:hypothetical protein n=1 Tax=Psychrobacter sp. NZS113 TaxID=2792045 RepID=UPI0018CEC2ED|nr:hypothetical protein [Psychrobacter sp. NZS113]MBH0096693.1 hypothetical protein [Psychrobacter sp. NZS113]